MRRIVAVMAFVAMALAAAGCNFVTDEKYFREGAGADLYSSDAANQLDLQNQYIVYVCEQAGLATAAGTCGATFDPPTWALFVQAGMNDIDQRCDAYLTWLDAERRNRAPVLAEIASIGGATAGIMTVAGAGPKALGIASAAFALASDSYSHWNSRLLLAVEQSTVQEIVINRQQQYRATIADAFVPDRAYAIYLLRNYLRICMPITIETEINTGTKLVLRGAPAAAAAPFVVPVPRVPVAAVATIVKPPRIVAPPVPSYAAIFVDYSPAVYRPSFVRRIQAALCVPQPEQGSVGVFTPNLIAIYQDATRQTITRQLDSSDVARILSPPSPTVPCSSSAENYYERTTYTDANKVSALIKRLNKSPAGGSLPDGATIIDARAKIAAVRATLPNLKLQLPAQLAGQMTRDLDVALFNLQ